MDHTMVQKKIGNILINKCLITNSKKLFKIIDLGIHPFADTFIGKNKLNLMEPVYPLQCFLCKESGSIQLKYFTDSFMRYNLYDYSYTSSNSKYSRSHWTDYFKKIIHKLNLEKKSRVLEIGSNDGYLLNKFYKKDFKVVGVDSSLLMTKISRKKGIRSFNSIFNLRFSHILKSKYSFFDLIIANNVLNHSNDPLNFIRGVRNLMNNNSTFVFELPYWYETVNTKRYDQVYHEHVTYFTIKFAKNLFNKCGMYISDIEINSYHGGSIRVYCKKKQKKYLESKIVKKMILKEEKKGLFDPKFYNSFMKKIEKKRNVLLNKLLKIKNSGGTIIGIGAAAKGNTFLNYHKLDHSIISYVTDPSPYKKGKYTPLSRIPIVSDKIISKYRKVYGLMLSWNISKEIIKKLKKFNKNLIIIK